MLHRETFLSFRESVVGGPTEGEVLLLPVLFPILYFCSPAPHLMITLCLGSQRRYNMTLYAALVNSRRSSCVYSVLLPDVGFYFPLPLSQIHC